MLHKWRLLDSAGSNKHNIIKQGHSWDPDFAECVCKVTCLTQGQEEGGDKKWAGESRRRRDLNHANEGRRSCSILIILGGWWGTWTLPRILGNLRFSPVCRFFNSLFWYKVTRETDQWPLMRNYIVRHSFVSVIIILANTVVGQHLEQNVLFTYQDEKKLL